MAIFQPQIVGKGGSNQDIQYDVMPEATLENLGRVIQYVGETIPATESSAVATQTVGTGLSNLEVDVTKFEKAENPSGDETVEFVAHVDGNPGFAPSAEFQGGGRYAYFDTEKLIAYIAQYTDHTDYKYVSVRHAGEDSNSITIYMNSNAFVIWGSIMAAYKQITGITDSDLENIVGITLSDYTYYSSEKAQSDWNESIVTWTKNGLEVNIDDYGVSYSGVESDGDTLEVNYYAARSNYEKGYFYENQAIRSEQSLKIEKSSGGDYIDFVTISGHTTMSGSTQSIANLFSSFPTSSELLNIVATFEYDESVGQWNVGITDYVGGTAFQSWRTTGDLEGYGLVITGAPRGGDHVKCTYIKLYNLSVDMNTFIEKEHPTKNETINFVAEVTPASVEYTQQPNWGINATADSIRRLYLKLNIDLNTESQYLINNLLVRYYNENNVGFGYEGSVYMNPTVEELEQEYGITFTGTPVESEELTGVYTQSLVQWFLDENEVNVEEYGVLYEGTPVDGNVLTVTYTAPGIVGCEWVQKDVQPTVDVPPQGIDWKTKLDIPADYPNQYRWSCAPIYTIPGGLPDGKYEVYMQIKTIGSTEDNNYPYGLVTYKFEFGLRTSGNTKYCYGQIGYVIDGNWTPRNSEYTPKVENYWNMFYLNNNDLQLFSTSNAFMTDILQNGVRFVSECYKLSAIKNIDTGEEYIATGELYKGSHPYTNNVQGYLCTTGLAREPERPRFHADGGYIYDDNTQYIVINPPYGINNPKISYWNVNCSELDVSLYSMNGGRYHVIVENNPKSYIARVLEASGDLANTQIGWDEGGRNCLFFNTEPGETAEVRIHVGMKACNSEENVDFWQEWINNFTPATITKVGGDITGDNFGFIEQYTGNTNIDYINGHFYKASGTATSGSALEYSYYNGENVTVSVSDVDGFIEALANYIGWTTNDVKSCLTNDHYFNYYVNGGNPYMYWSNWGNISDSNVLSYLLFDPSVSNSTGWKWVYDYKTIIQNPHWEEIQMGSKTIFRQWIS